MFAGQHRDPFILPMRRGTAFTLLELMICIFLLLILMLGLHAVFSTAEHSVNAGQTLSQETGGIRAAQAVMARDFAECAADSPAFVLSSSRVSWFATQQDALANQYASPLQLDLQNNGHIGDASVAGNVIPPAAVNFRSHRVDMLSFFARGGPFHRQTGDTGSFANNETSNEAWIVYGHLALPARNNGNQAVNMFCGNTKYPMSINLFLDANGRMAYFRAPEDSPGAADGKWLAAGASTYVGAYAADWMLGRNVILLKDPSLLANGEVYIPARTVAPDRQWMQVVDRASNVNFVQPWPWQINLTPLGYDSPFSNYTPASAANPPFAWNGQPVATGVNPVLNGLPTDRIQDSRYDLAGTTIEQFRQTVGNALEAERAYQTGHTNYQIPSGVSLSPWVRWWHPLVFNTHPIGFIAANRNQVLNNFQSCPLMMLFFNPTGYNPDYSSVPPQYEFPETGGVNYRFHANPLISCPLDAMMAAQATPSFLPHVSQFIVEYAGDFVSQDVNGNVTGLSPDGQIDYIVDPTTGLRRIRWYGLPRDVIGTGQILGYAPGRTASQMLNVVPLRDIRMTSNPSDTGADFEQDVQYYLPPVHDAVHNPNGDYGLAGVGLGESSRYICVWRNDVPSLIRITLKFDDPSNRLLNGQTVEMIYRLK